MPIARNLYSERRFYNGRIYIQPFQSSDVGQKQYLSTQFAHGKRFVATEPAPAQQLHTPDEHSAPTIRPLDEILASYGSAGPVNPIAPPPPGPEAILPSAVSAEEQGGRITWKAHKRALIPKSIKSKRPKGHGGLFH